MWLRVAIDSRDGMLELGPFPDEVSPEPDFAEGSSHRDLSVKWFALLSLGSSPSDEEEGEGEGPDCVPAW